MTTKTTARIVAGTALPAGAAAEILAVAQQNTPAAIAGVAAIVVGVTAVAIQIITTAIRDTAAERCSLRRAEKEAGDEYTRWLTARALLDCETERVLRVADADDRRRRARYEILNEELLADLESRKASLKREGYFMALDHQDRGILAVPAQGATDARIITLPLPVGSGSTASGQGAHAPS